MVWPSSRDGHKWFMICPSSWLVQLGRHELLPSSQQQTLPTMLYWVSNKAGSTATRELKLWTLLLHPHRCSLLLWLIRALARTVWGVQRLRFNRKCNKIQKLNYKNTILSLILISIHLPNKTCGTHQYCFGLLQHSFGKYQCTQNWMIMSQMEMYDLWFLLQFARRTNIMVSHQLWNQQDNNLKCWGMRLMSYRKAHISMGPSCISQSIRECIAKEY